MDLMGFVGSAFEFQIEAGTPQVPPGDLQVMPWPPWPGAVPKGASSWSMPYRWKVRVPPLVPMGCWGARAMMEPWFSIRMDSAKKSIAAAWTGGGPEPQRVSDS